MSAASKIPPLRFKGFEGVWEEKRLGEMGSPYNGLSGKCKSDFGHGNGRYVTYLNVFNNSVVGADGCDRIEVDKSQNEVCDGDVFFTTSSETPEEVGMASVWRGNGDNTYLNSFCFGYRPKSKINADFWAHMLRADSFRDRIVVLAQGISRYNISKGKVMELPVSLPKDAEQQKIGSTFCSLDALIADRESAVEKLQTLKKAMLEKMFPRAGAKVHEVRFKGCEGEWEAKRLGDAFSMSVSTNTLSRACLTEEGTVRNVHYGDILTKLKSVTNVNSEELPYVADNDFKTSTKNLLQDGDVVMADTAEDAMVGKVNIFIQKVVHHLVGKVTEIRNVGCAQVVAGLHTVILRPLDDFGAGYLGYYLNSDAFHLGLLRIMQGVKVLSINKSFLADYSLLFPSLHEQRKIGAYFRSLDALISARQEEVGKMKDLKKALLDRMFV